MNKLINLLRSVLTIIVVFLYVQMTAQVHVHEIRSELTVHSHKQSDSTENQAHTNEDFGFISQIAVASIAAIAIFSIVIIPIITNTINYLSIQQCINRTVFSNKQLRAPPIA